MFKRYYRASTALSFAALAMMFTNSAFITDALLVGDLDINTVPVIPLSVWIGYFLSMGYAAIAILCIAAANMHYLNIGAPTHRKLNPKRSSALGAGIIISQMFYLVFVGNEAIYEYALSSLQVALGIFMMTVPIKDASKDAQPKNS